MWQEDGRCGSTANTNPVHLTRYPRACSRHTHIHTRRVSIRQGDYWWRTYLDVSMPFRNYTRPCAIRFEPSQVHAAGVCMFIKVRSIYTKYAYHGREDDMVFLARMAPLGNDQIVLTRYRPIISPYAFPVSIFMNGSLCPTYSCVNVSTQAQPCELIARCSASTARRT